MMAKKSPNPTDRHVGTRVRMRRLMLGMSQEKLGDELGLTFQQVQKYEKGANRIGASRLQRLSQILQVSVPFFFEGLPDATSKGISMPSSPGYVLDFISSNEGLRLIKAYVRIEDAKVRRHIVSLVQSIAPADDR
jgi:transcriptional regulator with XRE-family HTH domain